MRRIALLLLMTSAVGTARAPLAGQSGSTGSRADPVADRGFLIAKATPVPAGRGHVTAFWPGFVIFGYGASDRVTLVGGTLPWLALNGPGLFFGSVRASLVSSRHAGVAIGASGLFVLEEGGVAAGGWPFAVGTVGFPRGSLTALLGVGTGATVLGDCLAGSVLLQGMGEFSLARGMKLIAEALYLGDGTEPIGAVGVRLWGSRGAFEIGWALTLESEDGFHHPWAAISYGF
jgi:hypothetical protein